MKTLYDRVKYYLLTKLLLFTSLYLAGRSDFILTRLSFLALQITTRDHYKKKIIWIRDLFEHHHSSIKVIKKMLRETHPRQRERIIKTFFINQLLLGSNKRKKFSEQKDGFYPPGFMVISPTMRCNLNCYGCYAGSYQQEGELTFNDIDRILTEGKEMGIYFAVISGGEPFLSKDILKIFERHSDVAFHVYTNGSLIDERLADRIAELGNILPAISVEGFKKETDARRGREHYEKVMEAMKLLRERKLLLTKKEIIKIIKRKIK
jgi:sulfatase maturation enzyme AslB (radical SAM superfamily)